MSASTALQPPPQAPPLPSAPPEASGATPQAPPAPIHFAPTTPAAADLGGALGGFALLGACAGLGAGAIGQIPALVVAALAVPVGAGLLTGPALLVVHQFLDLEAPPEDLVAVLGQGFVRTGRLAAALSPVMIFFAATSPSWLGVGYALMTLSGAYGISTTAGLLRRAEPLAAARRYRALVRAWSVFTALVALRIAADLLG